MMIDKLSMYFHCTYLVNRYSTELNTNKYESVQTEL